MHSGATDLIFGKIRFNLRLFAAYLKSLNHFKIKIRNHIENEAWSEAKIDFYL